MKRLLLSLFVLTGIGSVASAQSVEWTETRFHRVHLKNGNFIDGSLEGQSDRQVVLKLRVGTMAIRKDLIDRVEWVKIRTVKEAPKPVAVDQGARNGKKPVALADARKPLGSARPGPSPGGVEERVDSILKILEMAERDQKFDVMRQLAQAGEGAAPYLAERMESLKGETLASAANALILMKDKAALPVVGRLLDGADADLRAHAVAIVAQLEPENARPPLRLLKDESAVVRVAAVGALEEVGDRDSFFRIAELLSDNDRDVRSRALSVLAKLAAKYELTDDLVGTLEQGLSRARGKEKAELAVAAGKTGVKELWRALAPLLSEEEPDVRAAAAGALATLAVPNSGGDVLARLSQERENWPRVQLAAAAQKLKLQKAIEPLIEWLGDPENNIKMAASRALRQITGQNFGVDQGKWAAWWELAKPR